MFRSYGPAPISPPPPPTTASSVVLGATFSQRQDERRLDDPNGESVTQTLTAADDSATADLESGQALEVAWELPGATSRNYLASVKGTVAGGGPSGTFRMDINDDTYGGSFSGGVSNSAAAGIEYASGQDTVNITLVPTFSGGGTVSCRVDCRAIG